jgi:PilZ domain
MATVFRVTAHTGGRSIVDADPMDGVIDLAKVAAPGHYGVERISLDPAARDLRAWEWGEVVKDLNGGIELDLPPWIDGRHGRPASRDRIEHRRRLVVSQPDSMSVAAGGAMMSESDARPDGTPGARPDAPCHERRAEPRIPLREVRGEMSWRGEAGEVACEGSVLNISGGGAAVLAEDAPAAGQILRLGLHCESARLEPVEAQALEISPHPTGKQLIRLRFARWISLDPILEKHRERRLWVRYPVRESRAILTWLEDSAEKTLRGDLLNISGGGAAFVTDTPPPLGVPIWLRFEAGVPQSDRIDPIESRLVAPSEEPSGMTVAHIQFVTPCPMEFFALAVHGLG